MDREVVEALRKSKSRLRWIYPTIKAKDGTILDGLHRQAADPAWKTVTLQDIDTEEKKALTRIACNLVRREVSAEEKTEMLGALARLGWDAQKIAGETGLSERVVYKYLPGEFKKPEPKQLASARRALRTEPEIVPTEATKREPYSKGLSETGSSHRVPTYTESEQLFSSALSAHKVNYRTQEIFEREGEMTKDGKPKIYALDFFLLDKKVGIEIEGAGSSSKDNPERDAFFGSRGVAVAHLSNELVQKHAGEVAELIAILTRCLKTEGEIELDG